MNATEDPLHFNLLTVGTRLRITRLAVGLTQKGMAHPLNVTREAYTMYETGYREPPWPVAVQMCESWGVTLDWIYRGKLDGLPTGLCQKIIAVSRAASRKTA